MIKDNEEKTYKLTGGHTLRYTAIDNEIVITKYSGSGAKVFEIPSNINGLPVAKIGDKAFFPHIMLTHITIPASVKELEVGAFCYCEKLIQITIQDGVEKIGGAAFMGCTSLAQITIPASVKMICDKAFNNCEALAQICFEGDAPVVLHNIFEDSPNVTVYYRQGKKGWESWLCGRPVEGWDGKNVRALVAAHALKYMAVNNKILITGYKGSESVLEIPSSIGGLAVAEIGQDAFKRCDSLTKVIIPASVETIKSRAFSYCNSLKRFEMRDGIPEFGSWVFEECKSLAEVAFPRGIKKIAGAMFFGCESLMEITIPEGVGKVERRAFEKCPVLTRIYFEGDMPNASDDIFKDTPDVTVYYREGRKGWGSEFCGRPTKVWE